MEAHTRIEGTVPCYCVGHYSWLYYRMGQARCLMLIETSHHLHWIVMLSNSKTKAKLSGMKSTVTWSGEPTQFPSCDHTTSFLAYYTSLLHLDPTSCGYAHISWQLIYCWTALQWSLEHCFHPMWQKLWSVFITPSILHNSTTFPRMMVIVVCQVDRSLWDRDSSHYNLYSFLT